MAGQTTDDRDLEDFIARARAALTPQAPDLEAAPGRPAAVLMPLLRMRGTLHFLFTVRPVTMPSHAGEICFPGGRLRAGEGALTAALREAQEEVGIAPDAVTPIGFCPLRTTGSGHTIAPLLGLVAEDTRIRPCPREVAETFTAPLAHFLQPENYRLERARVRRKPWKGEPRREQTRLYRVIYWRNRRIWGATAGMLHDLACALWGMADDRH